MSWLDVVRTLPSTILGLLLLAAALPLATYSGITALGPRVSGKLALRLGLRTAMLLAGGFAIVVCVATVAVLRTGIHNRAARFERTVTNLATELSAIPDPTHAPQSVAPRLTLAVMLNPEARWAMLMTTATSPQLVASTVATLRPDDARRVMEIAAGVAPSASEMLRRHDGRLELVLLCAVRDRNGAPVGTLLFGLDTTAETSDAANLAWLLIGWSAALLVLTIGFTSRLIRVSVSERVTEVVSLLRASGRATPVTGHAIASDELQQLRTEVDRTVDENVRLQRERDRQYELIVERLPDAVLVCSGDRIRFVNAAAVQLFGAASAESLLDSTLSARLTSAPRGVLSVDASRYILVRDDGESRHVELKSERLSGGDDERIELVLHDVTARVRAEKALARSEVMYRDLFEAAPIGIAVIDQALTVKAANPELLRLFGRSHRAELIGRPLTHVVDLSADAENSLQRALGSIAPSRFDVTFSGSDRSTRSAMITVQRLLADASSPQYELLWLDLTAQRALEAQLLDAQKLEAVGQLSSGIAHIFNNLLTIVMANAGLMRAVHGASVEVDEIQSASMRGAALVRKLRAFGRRHDLSPRVWATSVLLAEFRAALGDVLPDTIALEWPTDIPNATVSVDRDAFSQVLSALASNAIEAMSGAGTLRVSVRLTADELPLPMRVPGAGAEAIEIGLSDTGHGLSAEARARAFEPFYSTKPAERGTGMGLAIVHGLVTQMGGGVALRDDPHGGTIATVLLPVSRDATNRPVSATRVAGRPQHVLLVDDDAPVRRSCARLLERLGLSVATAVHGRDALDQLTRGPLPDLVVTDVMMPEMGGAELVHAIRQLGWKMPVLLVSGYAEESLNVISLKDPHTSVLPKPWSIEDMTHALAARFDNFP